MNTGAKARRTGWSSAAVDPSRVDGEELLEPLRVLERADQREPQRVRPDDLLRDALHVGGGDRVDRSKHLVRLDRGALEHLAPETEKDQSLRILELEHEPSLREVLRLLELVRGHLL